MSKKSLIAAGLLSFILVLSGTFFLWKGTPPEALETGPAEVEIQTLAYATLGLADVLTKYQEGSMDSAAAAEEILKGTTNIDTTLSGLESKKLEPIELETSVATYLAFNNFFTHYETDFIKIDKELSNGAATTRAAYKTVKSLYEFVQDSVQNLQVPQYTISDETKEFIKRVKETADTSETSF